MDYLRTHTTSKQSVTLWIISGNRYIMLIPNYGQLVPIYNYSIFIYEVFRILVNEPYVMESSSYPEKKKEEAM